MGSTAVMPDVSRLFETLQREVENLCQLGLLSIEAYRKGDTPIRNVFLHHAFNADVGTYKHLCDKILELLGSLASSQDQPATQKKTCVAVVVAQLMDLQLAKDDTEKFTKLSEHLDTILETGEDATLLRFAAEVYGMLWTEAGGSFASQVDNKIRAQVDFLQRSAADERNSVDLKKLAALVLLREAAERTPSTFLPILKQFMDTVFSTVVHKREFIRVASAQALRAAAAVSGERNTRFRVRGWYRMWARMHTNMAISEGAMAPEKLHGLLLAQRELILANGWWYEVRLEMELVPMLARVKDLYPKDAHVRSAVLALIPALAQTHPEHFIEFGITMALEHHLHILSQAHKHPGDRALVFTSVGEMLAPLRDEWHLLPLEAAAPLLRSLINHLKDALTNRRQRSLSSDPSPAAVAAVECLGKLAEVLPHTKGGLRDSFQRQMTSLLEPMVLTGLSQALVDTLVKFKAAYPELENRPLMLLTDITCWVLTAPRPRPYHHAGTPQGAGAPMSQRMHAAFDDDGASHPEAAIALALNTVSTHLSKFDGTHGSLPPLSVDFLVDVLRPYLDRRPPAVYAPAVRACAHTCSALLERYMQPGIEPDMHMGPHFPSHFQAMREIDRTLMQISRGTQLQGDPHVRAATLRALTSCPYIIDRLSVFDVAQQVMWFLSDNVEPLRTVALFVRLAEFALPIDVASSLIARLKELLKRLKPQTPMGIRIETAKQLECFIALASGATAHYQDRILRSLVEHIKLVTTELENYRKMLTDRLPVHDLPAGIQAGDLLLEQLLACLGRLAAEMDSRFRDQPQCEEVLNLVYHHLESSGSVAKKAMAVKVIGQIMKSIGSVMEPYLDYPRLMSQLLRFLHDDNPTFREAAARTVGIIGALDPLVHKQTQASIAGEGRLEKEGVRPIENKTQPTITWAGTLIGNHLAPDEQAEELLPVDHLAASSEEYYPTLSINALMRMLRDRSFQSQHVKAVNALTTILYNLGQQAVPYLEKVMPALLNMMRQNDSEEFREMMLAQLQRLVISLRAYMNPHLEHIFHLLAELWYSYPGFPRHALGFLAAAAQVLRETMGPYISEQGLISRFREILNNDVTSHLAPLLELLKQMDVFGEEASKQLWPLMMAGFWTAIFSDAERVEVLSSLKAILGHMNKCASFFDTAMGDLVNIAKDTTSQDVASAAFDCICVCGITMFQSWRNTAQEIYKVYQGMKVQQGFHHEWFERVIAKTEASVHPAQACAPDWEHGDGWSYEIGIVHAIRRAAASRPPYEPRMPDRLAVDPEKIVRAAEEHSKCATKGDWHEWMRTYSLTLISQSPSPALRSCVEVAKVHPQMTRDLFAVAFQSCWPELQPNEEHSGSRDRVLFLFQMALQKEEAPLEVKTVLLALEEFMQLDDKDMGASKRFLARHARSCGNYAKALHHEEDHLQDQIHKYRQRLPAPEMAKTRKELNRQVEVLLNLNRHMGNPDAAQGLVDYLEKNLGFRGKLTMQPKVQWSLGNWDKAVESINYTIEHDREVQRSTEKYVDAMNLAVQCHYHLLDNHSAIQAANNILQKVNHEDVIKKNYHLLEIKAMAEWYLDAHEELRATASLLPDFSFLKPFFLAIQPAINGEVGVVAQLIHEARSKLAQQVAAPLGESYKRAYPYIVNLQLMNELEELAQLRRGSASEEEVNKIRRMWQERLEGVQEDPEIWQALLSVHRYVVPPQEDEYNWLRFAKLCRNTGRPHHAQQVLIQMLEYDPLLRRRGEVGYGAMSGRPNVMLAYLEAVWQQSRTRLEREDLIHRLQELAQEVDTEQGRRPMVVVMREANDSPGPSASLRPVRFVPRERPCIAARAALSLGRWEWSMLMGEAGHALPPEQFDARCLEVLGTMEKAVEASGETWSKAWHWWATVNLHCPVPEDTSGQHAANATRGFFKALATAQSTQEPSSQLQDLLRLITLWFSHEAFDAVQNEMREGIRSLSVTTWLRVIPQLLARIHLGSDTTRELITELMTSIGIAHPQALLFPLLVVRSSNNEKRVAAANEVLDAQRKQHPELVSEAEMVARELNRVAILWPERWHGALEEASRLYFGEGKVQAMLEQLLPLHQEIERDRDDISLMEQQFLTRHGEDLRQAHEHLRQYQATGRDTCLQGAWDLYYHVFRNINKQLPTLQQLDLQHCSTQLFRASSLNLAVPGTYIGLCNDEPVVRIATFSPLMQVLSSKQRPRRLTISGSDLKEYQFLLKGHEDLRQDERVMQLFGLFNSLLSRARSTAGKDLGIGLFAVVPLTHKSGLIGWLLNTDTMHVLIRAYREARDIQLNLEHKRMTTMAPELEDKLPMINKVEVFLEAVDETAAHNKGDDLQRVLWLNSRGSEVWLERRNNFTRSTAVMSMVGYVLGLGDRHPSNLLVDRYTGKLLHIDFGDCFELAMHREKFPEKWPFRLTRMMVRAMGPTGVEGNFRLTCEDVVAVQRAERASLLAMLEAFIYDPLINWRLPNIDTDHALGANANAAEAAAAPNGGEPAGWAQDMAGEAAPAADSGADGDAAMQPRSPPGARAGRLMGDLLDRLEAENVEINDEYRANALRVMKRVTAKLDGKEVKKTEVESVQAQVARLIDDARNVENLCQAYVGWCPFW